MNEKRQVNDLTTNKLGRLVGPLAFVILTAAVCLLLLGSPLRAAPGRSLFEQTTLTLTNVLTPTATLGPGKRIQIPRIDKGEGWDTRIQAQNVGGAQTGVISLFWGDYSGQCPGIGPMYHLCHPILDSWGILAVEAQIPAEAKSAILYSQTTTGSDFEARNCDKISRHHRRRLATKTAITVARSAFTG